MSACRSRCGRRGMVWAMGLLAASAGAQVIGGSTLLRNAAGGNRAFTGIARIRTGSTCTGFFVVPRATTPDSAPAYLVTAGHCVDLDPNRVQVGLDRAYAVTFNYFVDTTDRQIRRSTRRLEHATMKGRDAAIFELDATVGELRRLGVEPLELAPERPGAGSVVTVVGAPSAGVPPEEAFLRRSDCLADAPADLVENVWHFWDAIPNFCADIYPGASGSPLLNRAGRVVGVVNTTTIGATHAAGQFLCYSGQPCEVVAGEGFRYRPDTSYAVPLDGLGECFDAAGRFALERPGCPLDPGRQWQVAARPLFTSRVRGVWGVTLTGDAFRYLSYKVVAEGQGDCRQRQGYRASEAATAPVRIDEPLPYAEGRHYLCVIGGNTPSIDDTWQSPAFATVVVLNVDITPPALPLSYTFRETAGEYVIDPIFVVPEFTDFRYKVLAAPGAGCDDATPWSIYRRVPIRVAKGAQGLCLYGSDYADNPSPVLHFNLQGPGILPGRVLNAAALLAAPGLAPAPGGIVTVHLANLPRDPEVRLTDAGGSTHPLTVLHAGGNQINAYIPRGAAPGRARLEILSAEGSDAAEVTLEPAAPGVFTAAASGFGAPVGWLGVSPGEGEQAVFECGGGPGACQPAPLGPLDAGVEARLRLFTTGVGSGVRPVVKLSGLALEVVEVAEVSPGVEEITARLPRGFRLNGFLPLEVSMGDQHSNRTWLRFRPY